MDFMVMKWEENPGKGRCVARLECFQSFWMLAFNLFAIHIIQSLDEGQNQLCLKFLLDHQVKFFYDFRGDFHDHNLWGSWQGRWYFWDDC